MDVSVSRILAFDLWRFTTILCIMEVASREYRFESSMTTPIRIGELLERHRTTDASHTLVVIEAVGVSPDWVRERCISAGMGVRIAGRINDDTRRRPAKRGASRAVALELARQYALPSFA